MHKYMVSVLVHLKWVPLTTTLADAAEGTSNRQNDQEQMPFWMLFERLQISGWEWRGMTGAALITRFAVKVVHVVLGVLPRIEMGRRHVNEIAEWQIEANNVFRLMS